MVFLQTIYAVKSGLFDEDSHNDYRVVPSIKNADVSTVQLKNEINDVVQTLEIGAQINVQLIIRNLQTPFAIHTWADKEGKAVCEKDKAAIRT